jgi:hypothetical protein
MFPSYLPSQDFKKWTFDFVLASSTCKTPVPSHSLAPKMRHLSQLAVFLNPRLKYGSLMSPSLLSYEALPAVGLPDACAYLGQPSVLCLGNVAGSFTSRFNLVEIAVVFIKKKKLHTPWRDLILAQANC